MRNPVLHIERPAGNRPRIAGLHRWYFESDEGTYDLGPATTVEIIEKAGEVAYVRITGFWSVVYDDIETEKAAA